MELLGTVRCVDYLPTDPPMPVIKVQVREPVFNRAKDFVVPVDTGFAGYFMVSESDYAELATMEVAREAFGSYATMAGLVIMRRARVKLTLGEHEIESMLETPLRGGGKPLLGRQLLNSINLALLGISRKACGLESQTVRHT